MTPLELDALDQTIPVMALRALNEAQRRAIASGRAVLVIVNGELIQIKGNTRVVLRKVSARRKVAVRVKRAAT